MEQVERQLSFSALTIDSDPSFRMQTRPSGTGIVLGAGKPHECFESSRFTLSPRKSKTNKASSASTQSTAALVHPSEDDDDADLFSSPTGTSRPRKFKPRTTTASSSKEIADMTCGVTYKGKVHEYHPDYPPKPRLPRFKKNNSASKTNDGGDNPSSHVDTPDQPQEPNPPSKGLPPIPKQTRQRTNKEPPPTPPRSQPSCSPSPESRPRRPRPRPTAKRILRRVDSSDDIINPVGGHAGEEEIVLAVTKQRPKPTKKQPQKCIQKQFPLLDDPTFRSDQPLRAVSNLSPTPSPQSSSETPLVRSHEVKGKGKASVISEDDMEDDTGHAPQPFPLSTTFMGSTPKASKRHPEDETHSGGSERKKFKESLSNGLSQNDLPRRIRNLNTDFSFLDPNVDPSTLCPWCDQQLPADPTPRLKSLIESVRSKSYSSPRPSNPLGLGAPLTASVTVCQRHRFESHQIPKAQAKGWPTKIDFGKVKPRVEILRSKLEALLLEKSSDVDDQILLDEHEGKARDTCLFWAEMMKEVKSKGTRAMASSKGQFSNFKTLQPGYYGESGYLIIHQTIYQLFPPDTINPDSTAPLTPSDFIQRILVPEAAVYLIMEDLQSTYLSAIKTLRESVEYGVAMFPDTGGDNEEGTKAADEVVKERAKLRRKQLLEEEMEVHQRESSEMEVELELSKPSSPRTPTIPKMGRSKLGKTGARSVVNTSESELNVVVVDSDEPQILTQRPRTAKSRKVPSGYHSDASTTSDVSVASRTTTRSMKRNQADTRTMQPAEPQVLPSSQPKRQPSYGAQTSSDENSDVEIISDYSARKTRDRTKLVFLPSLRPSKNVGKGSKSDLTDSIHDTDSDDVLLDSSPFNVRKYLSQRTQSTGLEDLDMEETPKLQKVGHMKLNADPWEVSRTRTRQSSRPGSSQDLSHLVADD